MLGKRAGEYYTPRSVVRLLVEMLEPYHGRVYDPCCGSGGMFVQSAEFVDAHGAEGWLIPDRLLGVIARAAWEDPAFRVPASTLVLDHFRSRLIAPGEGFATPRIAPGLIWMIVGVARVTPPGLVRLGLAHRAQRRALARLQRFAHEMLDESALPDDFWSHWIAWHAERRYGQRSELSPKWHSRLSAADRPDEMATLRRSDSIEPSQSWTTPEAIAAAYAAWYPINRSEDVPLDSHS